MESNYLELDDKRQYLKSYNEYPAVIEFNNSNNHALPQIQTTEPFEVVANNQSDYEVKDNKSYLSKSPSGITFGLIFGILIIVCGFFSEYIFTDTLFLTRIIILFIIGLLLLITSITLGMSIQNTNKEHNSFNCDKNSVTSLNKLNIDHILLEKINIPIKSAICNGDNLNDINNSNSKKVFMGFSITVTIILFLLFLYGFIKKNQPNEFLLVSPMKYIFIILLMFIISSLMVCFKSAIQINNKRYKCDDLTSFNERINNLNQGNKYTDEYINNLKKILKDIEDKNINIDDKDITSEYINNIKSILKEIEEKKVIDEYKNNLEKILKEHNLNMDSLICINDLDTYMYQDGYILKENKQTNNSFDGLLFFTYIVILSLLIAFVIGIILNSESDFGVIHIIILWGITMFCFASVIYPWTLNTNPENNKKVNLITGLVSTILPTILFIILVIINKLFS